MENEAVLDLRRRQAAGARCVFSVCTGALICGAAGLIKGRRATTHWNSFDLLPFFGAIPVNERLPPGPYSTVTLLARLRGLSTSQPNFTAR